MKISYAALVVAGLAAAGCSKAEEPKPATPATPPAAAPAATPAATPAAPAATPAADAPK